MKYALFFIAAIYSAISMANSEKILVIELSMNAFILKSADYGTNIGLLKTTKGIVLVDPMPGSENLDALYSVIEDLFGAPPKYILNTHDHEDHSGGNAFFTEKGSTLLADSANIAEIEELAATSHSPKDRVFFHKESNSIFVGDIYDTSWHPTFYAGGVSGFNSAIERILKLGNDESTIVPGHGKPTRKAEMQVFRTNTLAWISRVRKLKDVGMTVSEIKNDAQIRSILGKFNVEDKDSFIPEEALGRFIERTQAVIEKGV